MPKSNSRQKPRKTLRQALRDLLRRNASLHESHPSLHTIGSGILRKAPSPVPQLPNFSTVSSFPDFATTNYSADSLMSRTPTPTRNPRRSPTPRVTRPNRQLLPSLSLVDLNGAYFEHHGPQQASVQAVPQVYESGLSRQASLVSVISRPPSVSSLRIRASNSSVRASSRMSRRPGLDSKTHQQSRSNLTHVSSSQSSLKRASTRQNINDTSINTHSGSSYTQPLKKNRVSGSTRAPTPSYHAMMLIEHFKCFVVLDTAVAGAPVTGTSSDLRYIFDIGEQFVLNNQECEGSSIDIASGLDADGNQVVHLLLFTPLISPNSGRSRFTLVALVDVTEFISESANQIPELDTISEESSITEEAVTPTTRQSGQWSTRRYKLSADDLLSGCSLPGGEDDFPRGTKEADEDIWLALAATEGSLKSSRPKGHRSNPSSQTSSRVSTSTAQSHASSTDDILEDFMMNLQELYSDLFVLGPSPFAADAYEICNVSPKVYESKEYIEGHLSHTSVVDVERLSRKLGELEPFSMKVRWGTRGEEKRLYCNPLYGGTSITWICYLVDIRHARYW